MPPTTYNSYERLLFRDVPFLNVRVGARRNKQRCPFATNPLLDLRLSMSVSLAVCVHADNEHVG